MIKLFYENKSFYTGFLNSLKGLANPRTVHNFPGYDEITMDFDMFCESILTWPELSKEQHEKLQKLYDMLENYDEFHPDNTRKTDEEVCNDPE